MKLRLLAGAALILPALSIPAAGQGPAGGPAAPACALEVVVLGAGQDAGAPQIGNLGDAGPQLLASSLGVIDREAGQRFLFDASPAITQQLTLLDTIEAPPQGTLGIDGIFLTHAHIGHYLGLAYLGVEAANAKDVPVFALPRMADFLRSNAPWSQLSEMGNITVAQLADGQLLPVSDTFGVWPLAVPHRDELSETAAFLMMTPEKTALYMPDLDSWEEWEELTGSTLEAFIAQVDYAFVDATFWNDNEFASADGPVRDMNAIPHPRIAAVMDRLQPLPDRERAKVRFIHYNHTNPVRDPASAESQEVAARGFNVARRGDRVCLLES